MVIKIINMCTIQVSSRYNIFVTNKLIEIKIKKILFNIQIVINIIFQNNIMLTYLIDVYDIF